MTDDTKFPELTIAIVNYNGRHYLEQTLNEVLQDAPPDCEIAVVDNCSTDDSVEFVRLNFPDVSIWERAHNDGPGHARNTALANSRSRFTLLLDNDVSPEKGCINALFSALAESPEATIVIANVVYHDRTDTTQFAGAASHFLGTVKPIGQNQPRSRFGNQPFQCSSLITSAFLVDRERLGKETLFNEDFFIYFEDHEAGLRSNIAGHQIVCAPAAFCIHREGTVGLSIRQTGKVTPIRIRQSILNRWYILLSLYQKRTLIRFLPALATFEAIQLAGALANGWGKHWIWALRELFSKKNAIIAQRRRVKELRTVPDSRILVGGPFPFNQELKPTTLQALGQKLTNIVCHLNWSITGPKSKISNAR